MGGDISEYLSNAKYYGLHPINQNFTHWIDDKLTLAFLLRGTEMAQYLPKYYYHITANGEILEIGENPGSEKCNANSVLNLLKEKKILAVKKLASSIGKGFYRFEYVDDTFIINEEKKTEEEAFQLVSSLRNYIIMEFLRPCSEFAKYCDKTSNTIRYLTGRIDGRLQFLFGHLRLGSMKANIVENYNAGGVLCIFDENGNYENGHVFDFEEKKDTVVTNHPDTGALLSGVIPQISEIKKATEILSKTLPELKYCGIDYVIDENNQVKLLEVNSLNSLDGINLEISKGNRKAADFLKSLKK